MAPRPTWKGSLKISLVAIPIQVFPATESAGSLSFNQLHKECSTRIQQKRWCSKCQREVPNAEIVKGFEFEKGKYVVLSEEDFDAVAPESTRVIDLVQFAKVETLDPRRIDRTYYLAPDGQGAEAFAVIRQALRIGLVGIGKLAIYGRDYLVAVRPYAESLLLHTLHHDAEIRRDEMLERAHLPLVETRQLKLARQVIAAFTKPLDLSDYQDDYRIGLQAVIDAKIAGKQIVAPVLDRGPAVADLREALTLSLQAVTKATKLKMAKATTPRARKAR